MASCLGHKHSSVWSGTRGLTERRIRRTAAQFTEAGNPMIMARLCAVDKELTHKLAQCKPIQYIFIRLLDSVPRV